MDPSIGIVLEAATIESLAELFTRGLINVSSLPSWVPDWRIRTDDADFMFLAMRGNC